MAFITFVYKIGSNPRSYYGKYVFDYISDDHNGLDTEIIPLLVYGLNIYRKQKNQSNLTSKSKIHIGILSLSYHPYIPLYTSDINAEVKAFDFYYYETSKNKKLYINGKLMNDK